MFIPEQRTNSEGYCKKCNRPLGIDGVCYGCAMEALKPLPETDDQFKESEWVRECPNCGGNANEQLYNDPDKGWVVYGWQCKACWRTYFLDGTYTY